MIRILTTNINGDKEGETLESGRQTLDLCDRRLVTVSNNIAQLTRVTKLEVRLFFFFFRVVALTPLHQLHCNAFTEIPSGVLTMTQLTSLSVSRRRRLARC